ncbi:MotA/TolQ/ExbB proton channel family protein [Bowmanella denitrificans]|uniref:MotA/TolQ/ExbB proton channel family protein n=1 Tax=Bowmanella denitrificans TaxID=366582 RepID=UPI000C99910C|nr:MotA/TolQ/ExbB proton channel family protein [Bowmanella denitrificans]
MIKQLEELMYQLSDLFMAPVLVLLILLFAYSLFALGALLMQWQQRRRQRMGYINALQNNLNTSGPLPGYPLLCLRLAQPQVSRDELDVAAFNLLENARMVSRLAPMLGLVATMVPMGPALKSLANGNIQGISENLIVAFSAVIFGLVTASITFWIASVRKRWLASELVALAPFIREQSVYDTAIRKEVEHDAAA